MLLLSLALLFSALILIGGGVDYLPALLPFFALVGYTLYRGPSRALVWALLLLAAIIAGMAFGPLASNWLLNRVSHAIVAGGLCYILAVELGRRGLSPLWALVLVIVLGLALEGAEEIISPDWSRARLLDSGADLVANLVGALSGLLLYLRLSAPLDGEGPDTSVRQ